jgi:hypothetical protein
LSQSSNNNILSLFIEWLVFHEFRYTFEEGTPASNTDKGRAPMVRVQGNNQIRKFLMICRQSKNSFLFAGVKMRDFLLVEDALPKKLTGKQRIGFKKSLHKAHRQEPDFVNAQTVSRETYENFYKYEQNSSIFEPEDLLEKIDTSYAKHCSKMQASMLQKTLYVDPAWVCGVVDGDGHYHIDIRFRNDTFEGSASFFISTDVRSKLTLEVLQYVAGSEKTIHSGFSRGASSVEKTKEQTSVNLSISRQKEVQKIHAVS